MPAVSALLFEWTSRPWNYNLFEVYLNSLSYPCSKMGFFYFQMFIAVHFARLGIYVYIPCLEVEIRPIY